MQFIYNLVWWVLSPLVPLLWHWRQRRGKEDASRRGERFGRASQPRPDGKLVWLHGASVGESLSLLPMIDAMRQHHPDWRYLVTTGTVTSAHLMQQRLPPEAIHQYIPFDHPLWVRRFINHWRPDGVLWVESDIWPNLIAGIRRARMPAVLLNARMSERSVARWKMFGGWGRYLLGAFQLVAAQTADIAQRIRPLVTAPVLELGNLKFVSKPLPVDTQKLADLQGLIGMRPVWLIASTHAPEEDIAARTHQKLLAEFPDLLTIIALRHPARGAAVAEQLSSFGPVARRSLGAAPQGIYLADTLSEMGVLYSAVKTVAMGGSFTVGGHNPIEPAQFGCAVVCGPLMYNFTGIIAAFDAAQAFRHAVDEADLAKHVAALLRDAQARAQLGAAAQQVCEQQARSLPRLWDALAEWRQAVADNQPLQKVA